MTQDVQQAALAEANAWGTELLRLRGQVRVLARYLEQDAHQILRDGRDSRFWLCVLCRQQDTALEGIQHDPICPVALVRQLLEELPHAP